MDYRSYETNFTRNDFVPESVSDIAKYLDFVAKSGRWCRR